MRDEEQGAKLGCSRSPTQKPGIWASRHGLIQLRGIQEILEGAGDPMETNPQLVF